MFHTILLSTVQAHHNQSLMTVLQAVLQKAGVEMKLIICYQWKIGEFSLGCQEEKKRLTLEATISWWPHSN